MRFGDGSGDSRERRPFTPDPRVERALARIPRNVALVKLEDDRVVIACYSSKNFEDPVAWVEDIERRTGKAPRSRKQDYGRARDKRRGWTVTEFL
jgi:hypothetical protein